MIPATSIEAQPDRDKGLKPGGGNRIRSASCSKCILCGSTGEFAYLSQQDRLFGTGETWNLKRCVNRECGLIWLDPMPLEEDIGKAYANYYTHAHPKDTSRAGLLKKTYRRMKRGYWAEKYNYHTGPRSPASRLLGRLLRLFPLRRRSADEEIRFLPAKAQGQLLDVGCGSGEWLALMRELGWQVEGVDFDEAAVNAASLRKLEVRCGSLEQQRFPNRRFDAVTLNHVIEHVPDPVGTLTECARILKPGGRLVLLTPNSSSFSHRVFKQDWRGLEPPRHLHLFSGQTLTSLCKAAGFGKVSILPLVARSVIYDSVLLRRGGRGPFSMQPRNRSAALIARLFNLAELFLIPFRPSVSDCIAAIAVKE